MTYAAEEDATLRARVEEAHRAANEPLTREDVAAILAEVVGSMEGDVSALDIKLYRELDSLARYIQNAKAEIAAIRPEAISEDYIVSATDELDAVVGATEEATGRILDAAEEIMTVSSGVEGEAGEKLMELATGIFEASNFQDITGQRITKVVKTLKHIEEKVDALLGALGEEVERARSRHSEAAEAAETSDADLLNGPQLPAAANDQDEIDRLLASFD
jgi:chemotaxis protein CheZ